MHEWIPILLGCCLSSLWRTPWKRRTRILSAGTGMAVIALAAVVASGEFSLSRVSLLCDFTFDLFQAAAGFAAGLAAIRSIRVAAAPVANHIRRPGY